MQNNIKIGIVTYNIAKDWTLDDIFRNLPEAGFRESSCGPLMPMGWRGGPEPGT
ncbi:MAG: hypothetical protein IPI28_00765 [Candidatus Omnitrophica bacterium]|nr:hypothetical protein [Candidatus Omnitrophota bacterium]